jgi:hypothetical protein
MRILAVKQKGLYRQQRFIIFSGCEGHLSQGVKQPGFEADQTPLSNAEVKRVEL